MSHHCHDEHCDHDHDDLPEAGEQFLLYSKIAHENVRCLNELEPNSGAKIIKPWNERMGNTKASRIFINRDDVDFDVVESYSPIQTWELVEGSDEVVEYSTRITKFTNVRNITLFFPENFGGDTSIIRFLGFKGEWTQIKKDPIITVYEASANPADHKTPAAENTLNHSIQ
ncbi:hypothetical protein EC973_008043 [Apophysomyces ossiformis]|uniref:PITH domain-containing protein n=1 Tax=Apophysomyces ossiformis TaxID=679940 RepID=A0A8H7BXB1_9FUNG|nr:hypothetical protein EC973_008043 [Apophysomyces ossiformis]